MITVKRLRELIADLPDDIEVIGYEGEVTGLTLSDPNNSDRFGFIHTGETDEPCDESKHDIAQLVKGSEKFTPLPRGVEFTDTSML